MRAGQEDLWSTGLAADIHNVGPHAVAIAIGLARQLLVAAQDGLGAAEIDNHMAVFDPFDDAGDDLADAILEIFILTIAFGFADFLGDDLFGGHGGDAPEIHGRQGFGYEVADIGGRVLLARFFKGDFSGVVLDQLDHFQKPP